MAGPTAIGSIDTIVALQAVEEPTERRRRAVRNGGKILDVLDRLKIGLLSGGVRAQDLDTLKKSVSRHVAVEGDPGLNDVLKQIDLRARVELAKLKSTAA